MTFLLVLLLACELTREQFLTKASAARVVYLGEHHDREADHRAQLQLLEVLRPDAVGFEMFERPEQPLLDRGSLEEIEKAWRWGFPWPMYAPLMSWGKDNGARLLALNAPRDEVRKVARGEVPIPPELLPGPPEYREKLRQVWAQHKGPADGFERFFMAQCLWDETMAESLALYLENEPEARVAVIVGAGHVEHGWGIPQRVARRLPGTTQVKVLFEGEGADYVWKARDAKAETP